MLLITNFKSYEESLWNLWINLALIHQKVRAESQKDIRIAGHPIDLRLLINACQDLPIISQWADLADYWAYTWKILPVKLKKIWCSWVLLHHSENRIHDYDTLHKIIAKCNEYGLDTIVCAENIEEWVKISTMWATYIAIEPPELIGWNVSISKANPEIIEEAISQIWNNRVIVWAWIKTPEDIIIAKKLWVAWILLASGITKAKDPYLTLKNLANAL